ncbi:hypothetical protein C900_02154 [Fulvivirga imtechensis AK7]|uniref:Uncharacterized protein n=1 Tax=Fulvivirga imtechensis AK7 TaxID=1237149 RepID=L8JST3_9BACT|nr:hypothetical protein C900_02154 [Fulvivirga imtechensis AK7]
MAHKKSNPIPGLHPGIPILNPGMLKLTAMGTGPGTACV